MFRVPMKYGRIQGGSHLIIVITFAIEVGQRVTHMGKYHVIRRLIHRHYDRWEDWLLCYR